MTAADHLARNAIRSAERETGAALAVERCAELCERLAQQYEDDAKSTRDPIARELNRLDRAKARVLRSAAKLMRERDVIPVGAL